jgi:hypothetical protein
VDFFQFDRNPIVYRGALWPIFWRRAALQPASDQPHIRLHSFSAAGLPSGFYTIDILFNEPNSERIISRASAHFQVQL